MSELEIIDSLHTYEVEYQVFQDDLQISKSSDITDSGPEVEEEDLLSVVASLREQNYLLNEKLQAANQQIHNQVPHPLLECRCSRKAVHLIISFN